MLNFILVGVVWVYLMLRMINRDANLAKKYYGPLRALGWWVIGLGKCILCVVLAYWWVFVNVTPAISLQIVIILTPWFGIALLLWFDREINLTKYYRINNPSH